MKGLYFASLLLPLTIYTFPTTLIPRGKSSSLLSILEFIKGQTSSEVQAWDYNKLPDMCQVYFSTYSGNDCYMRVTCNDGEKEYKNWQVCEINKQQYWHDDRIGDFSIEYTKAGGINSDLDGLHGPLLRVKNIKDWTPINLDEEAFSMDLDYKYDYKEDGPWICYYNYNDGDVTADGKKREWGCGIPKLGKGFEDFQNDIPDGDLGYAEGTCEVHITQYQKPNPATDPYSLEVWVKDANADVIGYKEKTPVKNNKLIVVSKLKGATMGFRTGEVDDDGIEISYALDSWNTDDKARCKVGNYDGGNRDMDCSFACGPDPWSVAEGALGVDVIWGVE